MTLMSFPGAGLGWALGSRKLLQLESSRLSPDLLTSPSHDQGALEQGEQLCFNQ